MKRAILLGAIFASISCGVESGALFQIVATLSPTGACTYVVGQGVWQISSSGIYDPWGTGVVVPSGFALTVGMQNHMVPTRQEETVLDDGTNARNNNRDIQVNGFEVCWFDASEGSNSNIANADCSDIPERQQGFAYASTMVPALDGDNPGAAGATVTVLTLAELQTLFGSAFEPAAIPAIGAVDEATVGDVNLDGDSTDLLWIQRPEAQDSATRNQSWGSFPQSGFATVVVRIRGNGVTQSGHAVVSNWHSYAVEVCIGCVASQCEPSEFVDCDPSDPTSAQGYQGEFPGTLGSGTCNPFQDKFIGFECVQDSPCTTT